MTVPRGWRATTLRRFRRVWSAHPSRSVLQLASGASPPNIPRARSLGRAGGATSQPGNKERELVKGCLLEEPGCAKDVHAHADGEMGGKGEL